MLTILLLCAAAVLFVLASGGVSPKGVRLGWLGAAALALALVVHVWG